MILDPIRPVFLLLLSLPNVSAPFMRHNCRTCVERDIRKAGSETLMEYIDRHTYTYMCVRNVIKVTTFRNMPLYKTRERGEKSQVEMYIATYADNICAVLLFAAIADTHSVSLSSSLHHEIGYFRLRSDNVLMLNES